MIMASATWIEKRKKKPNIKKPQKKKGIWCHPKLKLNYLVKPDSYCKLDSIIGVAYSPTC